MSECDCNEAAKRGVVPCPEKAGCQQVATRQRLPSKNLHKMKLHEYLTLSANASVLRVPGGWIYRTHDAPQANTFVPYNDEFRLENPE